MNILKNNKIKPIFAGILVGICLLGIVMPRAINADFASPTNASYVAKTTNKAVKTIKVVITAYSSSWDETTGIPGMPGVTTASGKTVADGIIANNMLPFGTKVRIPKLYGNKVFVVEDRMASYKSKYHIDIWMPDKQSAIKFGVATTEIEVLES